VFYPVLVRTAVVRLVPALAWMGLIFALSARSTLPRTPGLTADLQAILGHFGAYGVLALLLWWALGVADLPPGRRLALAFAGAVAYGVSDEVHQSFVPGRDTSVFDLVVDAIGAACALGALTLLVRWLTMRRSVKR
jgi:VanZ family protein